MRRTFGIVVVALVVGGGVGSGITLLVREGNGSPTRTAPEVIQSFRANASDNCPEIPSSGQLTTLYKMYEDLIPPVYGTDGAWYTGCVQLRVDSFSGGGSDTVYYCYRVKADTLEVKQLPFPIAHVLSTPCHDYPQWPKS